MDISLFINKVARRLFSTVSLEDIASKTWEISPAEKYTPPNSIFLEQELDNIIAVAPFSSKEFQLRIVRAESKVHRATTAYLLKKPKLIADTVYTNRFQMQLNSSKTDLICWQSVKKESASILSSSLIGNSYFADWVSHDLTLNLLAQELGNPVINSRKPWVHEPCYKEVAGFSAKMVDAAIFSELTIIDDIGLNKNKRERTGRIRTAMRSRAKTSKDSLFYLRRGKTGEVRTMVNEQDVESLLQKIGFVILEPEEMTSEEIVDTLLDAEIIVGIEGSQLGHAMYSLRAGGTLLILQPPERFNMSFKVWLDAQDADHQFAFTVGTAVGESGAFTINTDNLQRLLDKL